MDTSNEHIEELAQEAAAKEKEEKQQRIGALMSNERVKEWSSDPNVNTFKDLTGREPGYKSILEMKPDSRSKYAMEDLFAVNDKIVTVSKFLKAFNASRGILKQDIDVLREKAPGLLDSWVYLKHAVGKDLNIKALNTTDNDEWVPNSYSSNMVQAIFPELRLASQFQRISIPRSPLMWPVMGDIGMPYKWSEASADDPAKISTRTPTTLNVTFDAQDMAVRIPISFKMQENSIVDVVQYANEQLSYAMAKGLETALINGDSAETHMDTSVTATTDVQRMFDGLRKLAITAGTAKDDIKTLGTTGWTPACFGAMMRRFASQYIATPDETILVVPPSLGIFIDVDDAWKQYQSAAVVTAALATTVNGAPSKIWGRPLVNSSYIPDKMVDGLNTGAGANNSAIIAFNKRCYAIATQGTPSLDVIRDPETLQYKCVMRMSLDFKPWFAKTEKTVVVSYNVPTA